MRLPRAEDEYTERFWRVGSRGFAGLSMGAPRLLWVFGVDLWL